MQIPRILQSCIATALPAIFLTPLFVHAQQRTLGSIIQILIDLMEFAIPLVSVLALLFFLWGGARFVLGSGDVKGRQTGRAALLWGVVGLFVMLSVWGLVQLIKQTFFD